MASNNIPFDGVSSWNPKAPTEKFIDSAALEPNAKDHPDSLTPESPFVQTIGKASKPSGPFGPSAREF